MKRRLIIPIVFTMLLIILLGIGCTGRSTRTRSSDLVPRKEFVELLTDIYLADGLIDIPDIDEQYGRKDSLEVYIDIIENRGYTKEQVDNTLKHYFISRPKRLQDIYTEVLAALSARESQLLAEIQKEDSLRVNLWPGETYFAFPELHREFEVFNEFLLPEPGEYRLTFKVVLFPEDQSLNPRATIDFVFYDMEGEVVVEPIEEIPLTNDGEERSYEVIIQASDEERTMIQARLLAHDPQEGDWDKYARISNIRLVQLTALPEEDIYDPFSIQDRR